MSLKEKMRSALRDFLQIQPAQEQRIVLQESFGRLSEAIQHRVWYRGDPSELSQLYHQVGQIPDNAFGTRFWAQVPQIGSVRKAHAGLPAVIVDTLTQIVKADLSEPDFEAGDDAKSRWAQIAGEIDFKEVVGQAIAETLIVGVGAFKISIDTDVSEYPILEFFGGDQVEYEVRSGRIQAVIFVSSRRDPKGNAYTLRERYAKGEVSYELYNRDGEPAEMTVLPELNHLCNTTFDGKFMMAVPLRFFRSSRWPHRGRSIYSSKIDAFDILDEVISQWLDAIRAGRVLRYIPESLVPRDQENGRMTAPSFFQSNFVITETDNHEGAKSQIDMQQAEIRYEAFVSSYASALDRCLQGIMSPATLGIDVGKMASAEAQREKKDITGFTRNAMTDALEKALPQVIAALLMTEDLMQERMPGRYDASVSFGEYGAPDFDSRIATLSKASASNLMSVEAGVDELWGDSKDDAWKQVEVQRIKQLRGIETMDEPAVGSELNADMAATGGAIRADGTGADRQPEAESDPA